MLRAIHGVTLVAVLATAQPSYAQRVSDVEAYEIAKDAPPEIRQAFARATADGIGLVSKLGGGEGGKGGVYAMTMAK